VLTNAGIGLLILAQVATFTKAETVTARSGNGPVGGRDSYVSFLKGPPGGGFSAALAPADFQNSQTGPAAFIINRNPLWIPGLIEDPSAKWIGTNSIAGLSSGNTALYAVSFQLTASFASATLVLHYAEDDAIGDSANSGVYLNGTAVCGTAWTSFAVGFSQEHTASCDVSPQSHAGVNWLYIEDTNVLVGPTGLLFSATITTTASKPSMDSPGYSVSRLASGLSYPETIVYRPAFNDLLVSEFGANKVSRVDVVTGLVSPFGSTPIATSGHIAVNSAGSVYVTTNGDGGTITVFDPTGRLVTTVPVQGYVVGITFDSKDNLYVANNSIRAIARYVAGSLINPTTFASGFQSLQGITFDATGRLFAEDYIAGIVYYVTATGNTLWAAGLGSFDDPMMNIAYHTEVVKDFETPAGIVY